MHYLEQILSERLKEFQGGISKSYTDEIDQPRKDGSLVSTETVTHAVFNKTTGHIEIYGVSRDITKRKKAEQQLQAAEKNYKDIFDNATVGIFRSTPDGRFININMAMAKIYGYDLPEEMVAEIQNISKQIYANPEERRRFANHCPKMGKCLISSGKTSARMAPKSGRPPIRPR